MGGFVYDTPDDSQTKSIKSKSRIYVAVFFDGTSNNRYNAAANMAQLKEEAAIATELGKRTPIQLRYNYKKYETEARTKVVQQIANDSVAKQMKEKYTEKQLQEMGKQERMEMEEQLRAKHHKTRKEQHQAIKNHAEDNWEGIDSYTNDHVDKLSASLKVEKKNTYGMGRLS